MKRTKSTLTLAAKLARYLTGRGVFDPVASGRLILTKDHAMLVLGGVWPSRSGNYRMVQSVTSGLALMERTFPDYRPVLVRCSAPTLERAMVHLWAEDWATILAELEDLRAKERAR